LAIANPNRTRARQRVDAAVAAARWAADCCFDCLSPSHINLGTSESEVKTMPVPFSNMKTFNLTAVALLSALPSALGAGISQASLGETETQCMAKYGSESDVKDGLGYDAVGDREVTFHLKTTSGSLELRVIFLQGTVAHEQISSADPSRPLSEAQMKTLLDSESAGLKWRKRNSNFRTDNSGSTYGTETWSRSDGAMAKFYVTGKAGSPDLSGQMELSTKRFADAQAYFDKQDGAN
jgi:hypothetical protein